MVAAAPAYPLQLRQALRCPQPDRRPIYEWAHDHLPQLPDAYALRGRFNVRNSPWMRAPFDSMLDPRVRRTTVIKAIQSGGTMIAEFVTCWRIANNPGPCTFTMQSDEMASKEAKTRLWPLLRMIAPCRDLLPRPGPLMTQQEIYFPSGGFLILNSANLSHQQSQSVRWKINDEIWMPRWADVYEDACGRVTEFENRGLSHILDISQGGMEGDHADTSFQNGTREEWGALCRGCRQWMPLWIHQQARDEPERRAGLVWAPDAKREDGTYDDVRAAETARFVCPWCGHEHEDSDTTRAYWRTTGRYETEHTNPPTDWKSYHWEALVTRSLAKLAQQFCRAENTFHRTGSTEARIKFRQKREARPWKIKREVIVLGARPPSGYLQSTYEGEATVPGELARHLTIDKQLGHWWAEVGAWSHEGGYAIYRQLYFGRIDSRDALRELQQRYAVEDWAVGQDRAYRPAEVDEDCARWGWNGLEGSKQHLKRWMKRTVHGERVHLPYSDTIQSPVGSGETVPYMQFDGDYFKDLLARALADEGPIRYLQPDDANPLWAEHVAGEEKREVKPGVWWWVETKGGAPNHGLDTAVMQLVVAARRGIFKVEMGTHG